MAYFPNGTAGECYCEEYCYKCRFYDDEEGCPIFNIHLAYNYEDDKRIKDILNTLIPMNNNGLYPAQCPFFIEVSMNNFMLNIIKKSLELNGYDGLVGEENCGCKFDDLCPCGQIGDCVPGYIIQWGAGEQCPLLKKGVCECDYDYIGKGGFCMTKNIKDRRVINEK